MQSTNLNSVLAWKDASKDLIQRHLSSFQENDLETLITDYTDESVLITQDESYKGVEEIRGFFANLIPHFPKQESLFEVDKTVINGNLIYIVWHGETPSLHVPFATDTFVIKNGKILHQTFAGQLNFIA